MDETSLPPPPGDGTIGPGETLAGPRHDLGLWAGRILGERYRAERQLGRGGMGEVWLAYDLKLCVEVALKALSQGSRDRHLPDLLRREVRAAREVVSPNVCRVYDLIELDGHELVSMEYVDGVSLREHHARHAPLEFHRAAEIASQLLAGLQAIHDAGFVHRDLKPENIMITPAGRVVVMDFGIAKAVAEAGHGTIAGTPAYMAPEQARGERVDARADIYAAGVVLAELTHPEPLARGAGLDALWRGLRHDPPRLPDGPWRDVLGRAVAAAPEDRYPSARAFAAAIEQVTIQVGGRDDRCPYPGLASFSEESAGFFFGRESEVEALVKKLQRLHLVAVVGPSGVGKSSFLRAGLVPALPRDWACVRCAPGPAPFVALGQALAPHLASDADALRSLVRFAETDVAVKTFARWRQGRAQALLIVDQFEELFTQCSDEVQRGFAELLGRLPVEADVKVLLALRDDFLFHCHAHPGLRPILTELTLLAPLQGAELRRALVQPALLCGYRFESESLADRMATEVESERGALPLVAFAAAQLWERRDRERALLTTEAYESLGGVAGALARHAEATMEAIGASRQGIVRDLFRLLVTAQGTRLARERDELLSAFADRQAAADVLDRLVDARLLTSYELADAQDAGEGRRRIEIVHESLLSHWPRLVRWQTQDADGAQLRDQLRQAARLWDERGRPEDLLWSGTVYQEFSLWRERNPDGLTGTEDAFSTAMVAKARRRRRRRRNAVTGAFALLIAILATVGALWQRSARAERTAAAEARRAESSKLYTLARNEKNLPNALAYARAALDLSDQPEYRRLALNLIDRAPTAIHLPRLEGGRNPRQLDYSPDGRWLAIAWSLNGTVQLYPLEGGDPAPLQGHAGDVNLVAFGPDSRRLLTAGDDSTVCVWDVGSLKLVRRLRADGLQGAWLRGGPSRLVTCGALANARLEFRAHDLEGGPDVLLGVGTAPDHMIRNYTSVDLDPAGELAAVCDAHEILLLDPRAAARGPLRRLGPFEELLVGARFSPGGDLVAGFGAHGEVRIWALAAADPRPRHVLRGGDWPLDACFDQSGRRFALAGRGGRLWDLGSPGCEPYVLDEARAAMMGVAFQPTGEWLTTTGTLGSVIAWPLTRPLPWVLLGTRASGTGWPLFVPGDRALVTAEVGAIRLWPLTEEGGVGPSRTLYEAQDYTFWDPVVDDAGRYVFAPVLNSTAGNNTLVRVSLRDGSVRTWWGAYSIVVDATGRWVASSPWTDMPLRIFDCEADLITDLPSHEDWPVGFTMDGRLLTLAEGTLRSWDVATGSPREVTQGLAGDLLMCPDRETLVHVAPDGTVTSRDTDGRILKTWAVRADLSARGLSSMPVAPAGRALLIGHANGDVQVLTPDEAVPRRLPLHAGEGTQGLAVDARCRWIASWGRDGQGFQLSPFPSGAPPQSLPAAEFAAWLASLTNRVAVRDDKLPSGYAVRGEGVPDWRHPPR